VVCAHAHIAVISREKDPSLFMQLLVAVGTEFGLFTCGSVSQAEIVHGVVGGFRHTVCEVRREQESTPIRRILDGHLTPVLYTDKTRLLVGIKRHLTQIRFHRQDGLYLYFQFLLPYLTSFQVDFQNGRSIAHVKFSDSRFLLAIFNQNDSSVELDGYFEVLAIEFVCLVLGGVEQISSG